MSRRAGLLASAIGLVGLALALLARGGGERRAPLAPAGAGDEIVSLVRRPEPLAPAGAAAAAPVRVELRSEPGAAQGSRPPADVVRVRVVREEDREPLPDAAVSLQPAREAQPEHLAGTTDAAGICAFELADTDWARGELAIARVTTTAPGPFFRAATDERELFTGSVPLVDAIVLVAAAPATLHGHVLVEPAGQGRAGIVQAFEPAHGARTTRVFLGRAQVDPWNAFAIPVSPGHAVPVVELEVEHGQRRRRLVRAPAR